MHGIASTRTVDRLLFVTLLILGIIGMIECGISAYRERRLGLLLAVRLPLFIMTFVAALAGLLLLGGL